MSDHQRTSKSETTLIVLVSLLMGVLLGGTAGYLLGRSSVAPTMVVASPVPATLVSTTAPSADLVAVPTVMPPAPTAMPPAPTAIASPSEQPTAMGATIEVPAQLTAAPLVAQPSNAVSSTPVAQPSIPIPQARTATPVPHANETVMITDEQATILASEKIRSGPVGRILSNVLVQFVPNGMEIQGDMHDPTNQIGSGPLLVRGTFRKEGANLRFYVDSATVDGNPAPSSVSSEIQSIVNQIFRDELADRRVESYDAQTGKILVTVAQRS